MVAPGFTKPDTSNDDPPTSVISNPSGVNYVGASDGDITFTIPAGNNIPKFGGKITLKLPNWYKDGTDWTPVFTLGETLCESEHLDIKAQQVRLNPFEEGAVQENHVYEIFFKRYKFTETLTLKCSNYRNPIFR